MLSFDELGDPRVVNYSTISKLKYLKVIFKEGMAFYLTNEGLFS